MYTYIYMHIYIYIYIYMYMFTYMYVHIFLAGGCTLSKVLWLYELAFVWKY